MNKSQRSGVAGFEFQTATLGRSLDVQWFSFISGHFPAARESSNLTINEMDNDEGYPLRSPSMYRSPDSRNGDFRQE
jgi:hypothetical protein